MIIYGYLLDVYALRNGETVTVLATYFDFPNMLNTYEIEWGVN